MRVRELFGVVLMVLVLTCGIPAAAATINLAFSGTASQSSIDYGGPASRAIDGNTNGNWGSGSVTHTGYDLLAWWRVDLGQAYSIGEIHIWNRTDCCWDRLSNFRVSVLDASMTEAWGQDYFVAGGSPYPDLDISLNSTGRYVQVQLNGQNYLSLAEVQVYGATGGGVPEPATVVPLGIGLAGLALYRKRRN